jgi:hypothetical protein
MESPDLAKLRLEIARELYAQVLIRNEHIEQEDVTGVAEAIAAQLSRTFILRWAPDWDEAPPEDDQWSLDAARWRAS